jgi:hypothetical protein
MECIVRDNACIDMVNAAQIGGEAKYIRFEREEINGYDYMGGRFWSLLYLS